MAGATGLVGLVVPALGTLAGAGLLVLLAGALITHLYGDETSVLAPAVASAVLVAVYLGHVAGA
jgi:hypothetical protein